jgi:SAM-dependent methyltransferase
MTVSAGRAPVFCRRTAALADALAHRGVPQGVRICVVGCGTGREAAVLADRLGGEVIGIDIVDAFDPVAARWCKFLVGDATAMSFDDESFDLVYSYHALEHIPDYNRALSEIWRVLKPQGLYCIGTPNRARLVGYIGGGSLWNEKVRWNLADWHARLRGRFRNEFGAHAGYTSTELRAILLSHFSTADDLTAEYFARVYSRSRSLVRLLSWSGIGKVLFPSIYFVGTR